MASTQDLLNKVNAAIEGLLDAMGNGAVQEYEISQRKVKRADFGKTLDSLMKQRETLSRQLARENGRRVRVVRLGSPQNVDRR